MKLDKLLSCIWGCLLAFIVSFAGIACMVTAFQMAVDLGTVALWCGGAAILCAVCYALPLGLVPASALALISGFLWHEGSLKISAQSLLYRLSRQYDRAYGWGIVKLNMLTADDMELQLGLVLCLFGALTAMVICWAVCRRKSAVPGFLLALLPLATCVVVTDTLPQTLWLFLLLFGLCILLLSNTVRRQKESQGNRLCTIAVLPAAVALMVLFAAVPQAGYNRQENAGKLVDDFWETDLVTAFLGRFSETGTTGSSVDSSTVNLKTVGVRLESQSQILQVLTDFDATLYLRGRALDRYDGKTWTDSGTSTAKLRWPENNDLAPAGEVMITTRYAHRMLYLPYYVRSLDLTQTTRGVENTKKLTQYSFTCSPGMRTTPDKVLGSFPEDRTNYLHLSDSVKKWAVPLAQQIIGSETNPYLQAQAIADYVRKSAVYNTNTQRMPAGQDDFVRWFLEDSDTGYCVHFASAATVLLQAAGIPARYVTGYTADVKEAQIAIVRSKDAHAWAEYWLPGYGWMVLEATPADLTSSETQEQTTNAPDATEREETAPAQTSTGDSASSPDAPADAPISSQRSLVPLLLISAIGSVIGIAAAQRSIRLYLRRRKRSQGTHNAQALACWQETVLLARVLGETPDQALFELAQKAKFSQYAIQEPELLQFYAYIRNAHFKLNNRSVFHRFYYRVILALY